MDRSKYICQLDEAVQNRIRAELVKFLARNELPLELDEPMSGRVWDLEETLDLESMGL